MIIRSHLNQIKSRIKWVEDSFVIFIFSMLAILPFIEAITRTINFNSIPASQILVQHLTLWIGFLGAVLATRRNQLLALTRDPIFKRETKLHLGILSI